MTLFDQDPADDSPPGPVEQGAAPAAGPEPEAAPAADPEATPDVESTFEPEAGPAVAPETTPNVESTFEGAEPAHAVEPPLVWRTGPEADPDPDPDPELVSEQAPGPSVEPGPLVRVRMTVAYDGSGYRGFAVNLGVRTVAGELAGALGRVLGHEVALTCAGRTDAGVHAWGQVVHFDTPATPDPVALQRSLNKMLAPTLVVRAAALAAPGFDARRSATGRLYRYTVLNRPLPDPFLAATTWHVDEPLDLGSMILACDPLLGEHDWSSFCKRPPGPDPERGPRSMVRVVRQAGWTDLGVGVLRFEIAASAFCHQMVRSVVGTLVAVGRGRMRAGDIAALIRAGDRAKAAEPAPPHGLCLWRVTYPDAARAAGRSG